MDAVNDLHKLSAELCAGFAEEFSDMIGRIPVEKFFLQERRRKTVSQIVNNEETLLCKHDMTLKMKIRMCPPGRETASN